MDATMKPSVSISAVVTRANGDVEDLGIICGEGIGILNVNEVKQTVAEDLELLEETKNEEESEE